MYEFQRPHSSSSIKPKIKNFSLLHNNHSSFPVNSPSLKQKDLFQNKPHFQNIMTSRNSSQKKFQIKESLLDKCHYKNKEIIEKFRNDLPKHEIINMRMTPVKMTANVNKNSNKFPFHLNPKVFSSEIIRRNSSLNQTSQSFYTTQTSVSEYLEIMNKRRKKIKEMEKAKRIKEPNYKNILNKNSNRFNSSKQKKEDKYKPIIKYDNTIDNFNGYKRYNERVVKGVRNRLHQYYNEILKSQEIFENESYLIKDIKNISNINNSNNNGREEFTFQETPLTPIIYNNDDNAMYINKENEGNNNFRIQSFLSENSKNNQSDVMINEINRVLMNSNESNWIKKNILLFNKKTKVGKEKIGKRENDLKLFIKFTEGLSAKKTTNNEQGIINAKKVAIKEPILVDQEINLNQMKIVDYDSINNSFQSKQSNMDEMKLDTKSKAFIEEKLKLMKQKMEMKK